MEPLSQQLAELSAQAKKVEDQVARAQSEPRASRRQREKPPGGSSALDDEDKVDCAGGHQGTLCGLKSRSTRHQRMRENATARQRSSKRGRRTISRDRQGAARRPRWICRCSNWIGQVATTLRWTTGWAEVESASPADPGLMPYLYVWPAPVPVPAGRGRGSHGGLAHGCSAAKGTVRSAAGSATTCRRKRDKRSHKRFWTSAAKVHPFRTNLSR
jgi:hypothetical protein